LNWKIGTETETDRDKQRQTETNMRKRDVRRDEREAHRHCLLDLGDGLIDLNCLCQLLHSNSANLVIRKAN
jgi:hypothetical protein